MKYTPCAKFGPLNEHRRFRIVDHPKRVIHQDAEHARKKNMVEKLRLRPQIPAIRYQVFATGVSYMIPQFHRIHMKRPKKEFWKSIKPILMECIVAWQRGGEGGRG